MKESKDLKRLAFSLIVICTFPWLTGCESGKHYTMTGLLWDKAEIHPCTPKLGFVAYQTADHEEVLVRYKENREDNDFLFDKQRSFLLIANQQKIKSGEAPSFLNSREAGEIQKRSIPLAMIYKANYKTNTTSIKEGQSLAVISQNKPSLTLVSEGKEIGSYDLPKSYFVRDGKLAEMAKKSRLRRVLLTPVAVTGDITIYSAWIGCVALIAAGPGLAQVLHK
jgi:hypothetical protein